MFLEDLPLGVSLYKVAILYRTCGLRVTSVKKKWVQWLQLHCRKEG
jgi:hypothetical protein